MNIGFDPCAGVHNGAVIMLHSARRLCRDGGNALVQRHAIHIQGQTICKLIPKNKLVRSRFQQLHPQWIDLHRIVGLLHAGLLTLLLFHCFFQNGIVKLCGHRCRSRSLPGIIRLRPELQGGLIGEFCGFILGDHRRVCVHSGSVDNMIPLRLDVRQIEGQGLPILRHVVAVASVPVRDGGAVLQSGRTGDIGNPLGQYVHHLDGSKGRTAVIDLDPPVQRIVCRIITVHGPLSQHGAGYIYIGECNGVLGDGRTVDGCAIGKQTHLIAEPPVTYVAGPVLRLKHICGIVEFDGCPVGIGQLHPQDPVGV